jgi:hypothetical protein
VLDELPSLELAATFVALVLLLRALLLSRGSRGLLFQRARVERGRARDLVGMVLIVGAALYTWGTQRASNWFLVACGVALLAQLAGFYWRSQANAKAGAPPQVEVEFGEDDEELLYACPSCGHAAVIEIDDPRKLLGGLSSLTGVSVWVCPSCGAVSGQVEDPARIPIGSEHGTVLRRSLESEDHEALEEPAEHDG